ncbi:hypothetical protein EXIGLDRAFT_832473 [Exidia glandulosa HHB12029]|uniref:Mid2 domain-containing protein n=1 Tax=Exidia glandulosa HHB12029 TaxID=1314781 RepID=A0A165LLU9_EXIGL|nr:hypothetical protein EXIGLDRAFT_832473 [Exidia glandulosa HHB12029]
MRFRLCLFLLLGSAGVRTYAQTPTIFGASSPNWALIGNVTRVPRSQVNSFCSTPAGHEDDQVLLVLDGGQLAEPTLTFQGAAVIVHGALLTGIHENVQTDIDDTGRSLPLVFPDSSVDPNTGAVCDIILAAYTDLFASGTHRVSVTPNGDGPSQIVIFNATVFDVPIDLPGSPPDAESSSTTSAITATTTTTITSTTTPARNETSSTSTSRDSGSAPGASDQQKQQEQHQRSSIPIAAIVVPIVLVVLLTAMGLFFFRRRRAQRRLLTLSHNESNTVQPFPQSRPPATVARKGDAAALPPLSMAESSSNPMATERSQKHLLLAKPPLGDTSTETRSQATSSSAPAVASSDDTLTADPAQLLAIQQAVRRAGFSTQALLESLNRVQPESEGGVPNSSRSRNDGHDIAPPHYDA